MENVGNELGVKDAQGFLKMGAGERGYSTQQLLLVENSLCSKLCPKDFICLISMNPGSKLRFVLIFFSILMDKQERLIEVICSSGETEFQPQKFHAFEV